MKKELAMTLGLLVGSSILGFTSAQELTVHQEAYLTDRDGLSGFGLSVALDGDTAIIGVPYGEVDESGGDGIAYVYTRSNGVWSRQKTLFSTSRWGSYSQFGTAVALDGDVVLIGAPKWYYWFGPRGAAYSYDLGDQQLIPVRESNVPYEHLGRSVAVHGNTAIVSTDRRRAYVLKRTSGGWVEEAVLETPCLSFTNSMAIHANTVIIGCRWSYDSAGAALVFSREGGAWTRQATLVASDGTRGDLFGSSVALTGNTVVIGAEGDEGVRSHSGSAYIFSRSRGMWQQTAKLQVADDKFTRFGRSVAVDGDTVLVGARLDVASCRCCSQVWTGMVGCPSCPTCEDTVCALDPYCCDVAWDSICDKGARSHCNCCADQEPGFCYQGDDWGAAFVFTRSGGVWTEQANLMPGGPPRRDGAGCSVALDGDTAIVGAYGGEGSYRAQGAAYVFRLIRPDAADAQDYEGGAKEGLQNLGVPPEDGTTGSKQIRDIEPR